MPARLSVNLNAIALLRNRRNLPWPNVENIGRLALQAGAHGLTVHPRPDQRHIKDSDVPMLRALIDDEFPDAEFNIEGYPTREFIDIVLKNQPEQVTLVPDDPAQATSDHGWDFAANAEFLTPIVGELNMAGFRTVLFCDPDASAREIEIAAQTGAKRLELYTEPYGACFNDKKQARRQAEILQHTARIAADNGLGVNAGHDLTAENLPLLVKSIPQLTEVSIGHAFTADALEFGIKSAVKRYLGALEP